MKSVPPLTVGDRALNDQLQTSHQTVTSKKALLARQVRQSQVASAEHKALFNDLTKSDITSVKVLGEGAFGLVDLVLVDVYPPTQPSVDAEESKKPTSPCIPIGPAGGVNGWIADGGVSPRRTNVVHVGSGGTVPPHDDDSAEEDRPQGSLPSTSRRISKRDGAVPHDAESLVLEPRGSSVGGGTDGTSTSRSIDLARSASRRKSAVDLTTSRPAHDAAAGDRPGPAMQLLCVRKKLLKQGGNNLQDPENEAALLERCADCNFVVPLWSHGVGLYDHTLLMEYCPYGSLEKLLRVVGRERSRSSCGSCLTDWLKLEKKAVGLREEEAVFLAACLLQGLEELHNIGIIHRDLKPANCLIANNGYLRLADLGLAKDIRHGGKAHTKVGTPCFMAPEVVHAADKNMGYSYPCDLWAVGLIIWNMVGGALPKWSAMSWYWSRLRFPPGFSPALCDLLTGLLEKNPKDRLSLAGAKASGWFQAMDWSALVHQSLVPPGIPEMEELKHSFLRENSGLAASPPQ